MEQFDESKVVNQKYFDLYIDGDKYGEVKTGKAESALDTQDIDIAGRMGKGTLINGSKGTGTITFYKTFSGLLKKINDQIKVGKPFVFDLITELNDPKLDDSERVTVENCKITKFSPIDNDISKLNDQSFDFSYNPDNVTID